MGVRRLLGLRPAGSYGPQAGLRPGPQAALPARHPQHHEQAPRWGASKGRSGKAARTPPGFQPAPRALLGVGRAAPRPPGATAPLCALRRTGTPATNTKEGGSPGVKTGPQRPLEGRQEAFQGWGRGEDALACRGRYGPLSRFGALGTVAHRWPRPGETALAAGAAALANSI